MLVELSYPLHIFSSMFSFILHIYALSMMAQGNHRFCELVWDPPTTPYYSTNVWEDLRSLVHVVSAHLLRHYVGISRSLIETLEGTLGIPFSLPLFFF